MGIAVYSLDELQTRLAARLSGRGASDRACERRFLQSYSGFRGGQGAVNHVEGS